LAETVVQLRVNPSSSKDESVDSYLTAGVAAPLTARIASAFCPLAVRLVPETSVEWVPVAKAPEVSPKPILKRGPEL